MHVKSNIIYMSMFLRSPLQPSFAHSCHFLVIGVAILKPLQSSFGIQQSSFARFISHCTLVIQRHFNVKDISRLVHGHFDVSSQALMHRLNLPCSSLWLHDSHHTLKTVFLYLSCTQSPNALVLFWWCAPCSTQYMCWRCTFLCQSFF